MNQIWTLPSIALNTPATVPNAPHIVTHRTLTATPGGGIQKGRLKHTETVAGNSRGRTETQAVQVWGSLWS